MARASSAAKPAPCSGRAGALTATTSTECRATLLCVACNPKRVRAVPELTPHQRAAYAEVSEALDVEGYGDLLTGQAVDVHDAVAQMQLDAQQMADRAKRLHTLLAEADALAAQERRAADLE